MYWKKEWKFENIIQVEKHYSWNYGAPGVRRTPKQQKSPEEIIRNNEQNRAKKLQRLILANFHPGDWYLTLTYKPENRPADEKECKKILNGFFTGMRREFRKSGREFKFILVTETTKRGYFHHHMILEDADGIGKKAVMKCWTHGGRHFEDLYEEGDYEDLSEYLTKDPTKEELTGKKYTRSRNLIIPQPKKKKIFARRWSEEPKAPKGWFVDKDSVINTYTPYGLPVQHYTLRRLRP